MNESLLPPSDDRVSIRDRRKARTWAEVDLAALRSNVAAIRERLPADSDYLAVVKADAYGHGSAIVARECERLGIRHFGVASAEEGISLRRAGIAAGIYIFSPFLPEEASDIVRAGLIPFVSSWAQASALSAAADSRAAECVLALDTGMGREGCLPEEAAGIWMRADGMGLRISGVSTHFSRADEPGIGDQISREQSDDFYAFLTEYRMGNDIVKRAAAGEDEGIYLTLANSPATLRVPQEPLPMGARGYLMRGGLLTYGIEPYAGAFAGHDLRPVLSWRARVSLLRGFLPGATIGYGQTYAVERPSRIATLSVGYADGLSRRLSNRGAVLIQGRRCPIVGRVSMDQCQIDVTDILETVSLGDTATLIGRDGDDELTALSMAELIGTTPHEPTCGLTARVPRIYV